MTDKKNYALPQQQIITTRNPSHCLHDYLGKNLILYFYPKDNTPGCTTQGQQFRDAYTEIQSLNTEIIGVSRDSIRRHENFIKKHQFPFDLIADTEEVLCKYFDVIKAKKLYGKDYIGIERSTFLFNAEGQLQQQWRKVRVKEHVSEVVKVVKTLNKKKARL